MNLRQVSSTIYIQGVEVNITFLWVAPIRSLRYYFE